MVVSAAVGTAGGREDVRENKGVGGGVDGGAAKAGGLCYYFTCLYVLTQKKNKE